MIPTTPNPRLQRTVRELFHRAAQWSEVDGLRAEAVERLAWALIDAHRLGGSDGAP